MKLSTAQKRRQQNRRSQRAHRKRKETLVSSLEAHLTSLECENARLREINSMLFSEMALLQPTNVFTTASCDSILVAPLVKTEACGDPSMGPFRQWQGFEPNILSAAPVFQLQEGEASQHHYGLSSYDQSGTSPNSAYPYTLAGSTRTTATPARAHQ